MMRKLLAVLLLIPALAQAQFWRDPSAVSGSGTSSTVLKVPDGAVGAPAYSFINDPTVGFYRVGSGNFGFAVGGARVWVMTSSIFGLDPGTQFGWYSSGFGTFDTILTRDAADTVAQRRTTNPQTFRIYNTFTDASNYERLSVIWSSNIAVIQTEAAGTGTQRPLQLSAGSNLVNIDSAHATGIQFRDNSSNIRWNWTTGANTVGTRLRTTQATVPTITTNGGTAPACTGTDFAMTCTEGTSPPAAATFTVTFNGTYTNAPSCIALRGTAGASPLVQNVVTTTTTVQVNLSANLVASEKYHIHCVGV